MTDPKSLADAIDPRKEETRPRRGTNGTSIVDDTALIAASDAIRTLERERDDWKLQFDLLKEEYEQLSIHAALAGKIAIEEAAKVCKAHIEANRAWREQSTDVDRHRMQAAKNTSGDIYDAIRSLSKPIDRNALIERGARALWESEKTDEEWDRGDWDTTAPENVKDIFRNHVRAILSEWIGDEMIKTPIKILIHAIEFGTIERHEARAVLEYIGRLKTALRVNGMRAGFKDADINELLERIENGKAT